MSTTYSNLWEFSAVFLTHQNVHYSTNNKLTDHVERKVPKYEYHKIRERKVKSLTKNGSNHEKKGIWKVN